MVVLIHSSCCNRIPQPGWFTNNKNLLLTVLEAGSPRSRHWKIRCLVKACFLVHRQLSFCCNLTLCKGLGRSLGPFKRALIPCMRAPPSQPNHLPKTPPLNTGTFGIRFQHRNLRECKHSACCIGENQPLHFSSSLIFRQSPSISVEATVFSVTQA